MSTSRQADYRTRMFARVIGPFLAVTTATAVVRAPQLWAYVSEQMTDSLWTWTAGAFTLLAGLTVIALHPYWRGAAAIIVSVMGWLSAIKGLFLVMFPTTIMAIPDATMGAMTWWRAVYAGFAVLGLYLTYVGWKPQPHRPASQETSAVDLESVA